MAINLPTHNPDEALVRYSREYRKCEFDSELLIETPEHEGFYEVHRKSPDREMLTRLGNALIASGVAFTWAIRNHRREIVETSNSARLGFLSAGWISR